MRMDVTCYLPPERNGSRLLHLILSREQCITAKQVKHKQWSFQKHLSLPEPSGVGGEYFGGLLGKYFLYIFLCLHSLPNTGPVTLGCAGTGGQAEHRSASYPHQSSHTEHLAQAEGGDGGRCAPSALPSPGPPQHHSTGAISRRAAPPSAERARRWLPPGTGAGGGGRH